MSDKQTEMWDILTELDSETVLRVLTDWHGLQLLDDGFYGHLVNEGYIEEQEEFEVPDDYEDFCAQFPACKGCPLFNIPGDCEEEVWPKWKEEHQ